MDLISNIKNHYQHQWGEFSEHTFSKGPLSELPVNFSVLKFEPNPKRELWTYATCGMSGNRKSNSIELHVFSQIECDPLIELLTVVAHYHNTGKSLGLGHTVNFGCPWFEHSRCDHGLISLPYLEGPLLEWLHTHVTAVQFLWLIPVTKEEVRYKKIYGLESLEQKFDNNEFNYANPFRESIV